jgi:phosphoglycerate dehydrogenase-like enzyme
MKVVIGPNGLGLERSILALEQTYPQCEFAFCADRGALADALVDADVYFGWLDRSQFLAARRLRWIQSSSTGVNHFMDIPELVAGPVLLTSARGTHNACLAESVFAMILAFTRGVRESVLRQEQRQWAWSMIRPRLVELTGSTLGIIGFGASGRTLAQRAQAFAMRVIAVDPFPHDPPQSITLWGMDRLSDLLSQSDYVVVMAPYTPQTRGLIGVEQLAAMKATAMLVGISRGGIIDQAALADALRAKRLAAAALDVFDPEPLPADSELWEIENLLIMPHVAGGTQFEGEHLLRVFGENLGRFLRGEMPLLNQVDKTLGW